MRPKMMHFRVRLHMNPRRAEIFKEIKQITFSEVESYLHIMYHSELFKPFLENYNIVDLQLNCEWTHNNEHCSKIDGKVSLLMGNKGGIHTFPVTFVNDGLTDVGVSKYDMETLRGNIEKQAAFAKLRKIEAHSQIDIEHVRTRPNRYPAYDRDLFAGLGLSVPEVYTTVSARLFDSVARFIYIQKTERLWIESLSVDESTLAKYKNIFDLGELFKLYVVDDIEESIAGSIIALQVQGCSSVWASFNADQLVKKSNYMKKIKAKYPKVRQYDNKVSIDGYCVFVDDMGRFIPRRAQ